LCGNLDHNFTLNAAAATANATQFMHGLCNRV